MTEEIVKIKRKFAVLKNELDERAMRLWAATEAFSLGHGGIKTVYKATKISVKTIRMGIEEIKSSQAATSKPPSSKICRRIRKKGGGRKSSIVENQDFLKALERLIEPLTRGDPSSPLRWTCKSTRKLAVEMQKQGYQVSHMSIHTALEKLDYTLQKNKKTIEGASFKDRDEQFKLINTMTREFQVLGQPVISVDAKKKEVVGNFKNNGEEWEPTGNPTKVNMHDFPEKEGGKAIPYGIYDIENNVGFVNVGTDHNTAEFAVQSIRNWYNSMGKEMFPHASKLLITPDSGGSNGYKTRLWKKELQSFVDETGIEVFVSHFPPGTSKWNKIEHRMFSHITMNWRGRPLETHEVVVNLISSTQTKAGLKIKAELDRNKYEIGIKVPDKEFEKLKIIKNSFCEKLNYSIVPRHPTK